MPRPINNQRQPEAVTARLLAGDDLHRPAELQRGLHGASFAAKPPEGGRLPADPGKVVANSRHNAVQQTAALFGHSVALAPIAPSSISQPNLWPWMEARARRQ
jgi:hypothetical protein